MARKCSKALTDIAFFVDELELGFGSDHPLLIRPLTWRLVRRRPRPLQSDILGVEAEVEVSLVLL